MDWEGITRAYYDRERARLGLPTRVEEEALRVKREQEAALQASQLETAGVQREKARAEIEALPAERDLRRRVQEAQIRNYDEVPQQRAEPSSLVERIAAETDPARRKMLIDTHRMLNPIRDPAPDRVVVRVQRGVNEQGQPVYEYVPRSEVVGQQSVGTAPASTTAFNQARKRAAPVLADLGSRISSMNKGGEGGMLERGTGVARGVAGSMGMDTAADLYTTGVRGFTPLLARAVGHVGVLTEQDVARTEELFPRIGDSEKVTAEKLSRLGRIMSGAEPLPFEFENPEYDEGGITQPSALQNQGEGVTDPTAPPPSAAKKSKYKIVEVR